VSIELDRVVSLPFVPLGESAIEFGTANVALGAGLPAAVLADVYEMRPDAFFVGSSCPALPASPKLAHVAVEPDEL
jgi:hypothetical protein